MVLEEKEVGKTQRKIRIKTTENKSKLLINNFLTNKEDNDRRVAPQ